MKIELDCCVLVVKRHFAKVHHELLTVEPLLCSYLGTTVHPDVEYYYADRLPALIHCDSDIEDYI